MKKKYFFLLLPSFLGCHHKAPEDLTAVFSAMKPWRENVEITQQYVAQIRAIQHIDIRAFEKGYLQKIYVNEGQRVKNGQVMFQIMPLLMESEYNKAKAEYEIAKIEYTNTERLMTKNIVSPNELALAKAKLDKFAAEQNLAKTHLDFTTIKAPFSGIIDRFRVRLGSLIEEGELLSTLSDISQLWVYFNLSETDYLMEGKKSAAKVQLVLANGKIYSHLGKIDTIEADFDNETGTIPFRATFPNPDLILRHGETGNILLTKTLTNALIVPQKATFEVVDKRYVYVVNEKGVLDAREIAIDKEISGLFAIKSGLSEKDTVLLEGIGKLKKGETVRTKILTKPEIMQGLELKAE